MIKLFSFLTIFHLYTFAAIAQTAASDDISFDYLSAGEIETKHHNNSNRWIKPAGISTLVVGAGFLGRMCYYISRDVDIDNYNNATTADEVHSSINEIKDNQNSEIIKGVITGVIGGVMIHAGAGLLIWGKTKKDKTISIYPDIRSIQLVIDF